MAKKTAKKISKSAKLPKPVRTGPGSAATQFKTKAQYAQARQDAALAQAGREFAGFPTEQEAMAQYMAMPSTPAGATGKDLGAFAKQRGGEFAAVRGAPWKARAAESLFGEKLSQSALIRKVVDRGGKVSAERAVIERLLRDADIDPAILGTEVGKTGTRQPTLRVVQKYLGRIAKDAGKIAGNNPKAIAANVEYQGKLQALLGFLRGVQQGDATAVAAAQGGKGLGALAKTVSKVPLLSLRGIGTAAAGFIGAGMVEEAITGSAAKRRAARRAEEELSIADEIGQLEALEALQRRAARMNIDFPQLTGSFGGMGGDGQNTQPPQSSGAGPVRKGGIFLPGGTGDEDELTAAMLEAGAQ